MPGIDWDGFTWEAFATILTGVLAVVAALIVGVRQGGITSRQTDILESQSKLAELSLRHDLFERRYGVYVDVRDFLTYIVQQADYPHRDAEHPERDLETKFFQAIGLSRFYFGSGVTERLRAIQSKCASYAIVRRAIEDPSNRDHYAANAIRENDLFEEIYELLKGLPDLFGDALRLGG